MLLSPFAPHVTEEIWEICKLGENFASISPWPIFDETKLKSNETTIVLQVNGKFRGKVSCTGKASENDVLQKAKDTPSFAKHIEGREIIKTIYVKGRLLNVVLK